MLGIISSAVFMYFGIIYSHSFNICPFLFMCFTIDVLGLCLKGKIF